MTTFTVLITDTSKLAGITAARNEYNATNSSDPTFIPLATDESYVQFVMDSASQSYATHYGT